MAWPIINRMAWHFTITIALHINISWHKEARPQGRRKPNFWMTFLSQPRSHFKGDLWVFHHPFSLFVGFPILFFFVFPKARLISKGGEVPGKSPKAHSNGPPPTSSQEFYNSFPTPKTLWVIGPSWSASKGDYLGNPLKTLNWPSSHDPPKGPKYSSTIQNTLQETKLQFEKLN